jgi:hypothetical protein
MNLLNFSITFYSQVKVPNIHNSNVPIVFNAIGSSLASGVPTFGGIVYVYTKERILFWTPSTSSGHLVYVIVLYCKISLTIQNISNMNKFYDDIMLCLDAHDFS